jgi:hypothetical protein
MVHADDLRGKDGLQDVDGFLDVACIGKRHAAARDVLACALAQGFHVGKKWLVVLALGVHGPDLLELPYLK